MIYKMMYKTISNTINHLSSIVTAILFMTSVSCSVQVQHELQGCPPPLYHMIVNGATVHEVKREIARDPSVIGKRGGSGQTNLYYAVTEGRIEIAKLLLEAGEDPNVFSYDSPLSFAISSNNTDMVRLLLKHGADPMKPAGPLGEITPYEMAKSSKNSTIRKMLEEYVKKRAEKRRPDVKSEAL